MPTNNTLWVFGDSYAEIKDPIKGQHLEHSHSRWTDILADRLDLEHKNYGLGGSALEYSSCKFNALYPEMQKNDVLVLCITDIARKWIMKDSPTSANMRMIERLKEHDIITENDYDSFINYFGNILNLDIERVHCCNFLNALSFLTLKKNMKLVLLPCFEHSFHIHEEKTLVLSKHVKYPKKSQALWKISVNEFKGREKKLPLKVIDHRLNHLSAENHEILAELIYDCLTNDSDLDLNPEKFKKDLFTAKEIRQLNNTWSKTIKINRKVFNGDN